MERRAGRRSHSSVPLSPGQRQPALSPVGLGEQCLADIEPTRFEPVGGAGHVQPLHAVGGPIGDVACPGGAPQDDPPDVQRERVVLA